MKKQSFFKIAGSIFILCAAFIIGCNKETDQVETPKTVKEGNCQKLSDEDLNITGVKVENGILHFDDVRSIEKAIYTVIERSYKSYSNFTEKINFKSLANLEHEFFEKKSIEGINVDSLEKAYSSIFTFNDGKSELKIDAKVMRFFVNNEGIVKVGKVLYKFDEEGEQASLKGDKSVFLHNSLKNRKTDLNNGLIITNKNDGNLSTRGACSLRMETDWAYNSSGNRRGYMRASCSNTWFVDQIDTYFDHDKGRWVDVIVSRGSDYFTNTFAESQKRSWGSWGTYGTSNYLNINYSYQTKYGFGTLGTSSEISSWENFWATIEIDRTHNGAFRYISRPDPIIGSQLPFVSVVSSFSNGGGVSTSINCQ